MAEGMIIAENRMVPIDSDFAKKLGFTSDRFNPASYLWLTGNTVTISLIIANRKGVFRELIESILEQGFDFEILAPLARMREIGKKQNWTLCQKDTVPFGVIDILTNKRRPD